MTKPEPEEVSLVADDDDGEDSFSDLGASINSETTSLADSIRAYVYENGRRYHAYRAGAYPLPNDEVEQDRLDMFHHAYRIMLGGELHKCPLPEAPQRVLDLGTGTGIWAIDMADQYPMAVVTGVDLSPIQPGWVPSNCVFQVDDVEQDWTFGEKFDFIHSRNISPGVKDWPRYVKQIYDNLAPGGTVQLVEAHVRATCDDASIPADGAIETWQSHLADAFAKSGIVDYSTQLGTFLRDAGFEDVHMSREKIPLGPWAKGKKHKELGRWGLALTLPGFVSYGLAMFTRVLGMDAETAEKICKEATAEVQKKGVHAYTPQMMAWGRKPK